MTLSGFIEYLIKEAMDHPKWCDREVVFNVGDLKHNSFDIYSRKKQINFDFGTEDVD